MAIKVTGLMHAGVRIAPKESDVEAALALWQDLLGLQVDKKRPHIPGIPGFWINLAKGDRGQQIHVFGAKGKSPRAMSKKKDPTRPHVALAVEDLDEARRELAARNIKYWVFEGLVGRNSDQVFFEDGFGNMIELQQAAKPAAARRRPLAAAAAKPRRGAGAARVAGGRRKAGAA
jgi:catechol 2,3-dioxygenase-like lactoylglutathione lyase family enzyme